MLRKLSCKGCLSILLCTAQQLPDIVQLLLQGQSQAFSACPVLTFPLDPVSAAALHMLHTRDDS